MKIINNNVSFELCDKKFLKKFGFLEAANMVLDFMAHNKTPFIYDKYQLAAFFGTDAKNLCRIVKRSDKLYKTIAFKRQNGKDRILHSPSSKLKLMQKRVLKNILNNMSVSPFAMAYIKSKKLCYNAEPHTNKKYILKMDITDFFGSIDFEKVYNNVFNTKYFPKQIGVMLTKLCCYKDSLPQGAPTSPAISNLVMKNFDNHIGNWCKKHAINYTRYCDDMTFSSDTPLYNVYMKVKSMLAEMGFEVNKKKTQFVKSTSRQIVTGLTVNEKVAVPRNYKRILRQEIYYVLKYGFAQNILHTNKSDFIKDNKPDVERYYNSLVGKINFVLQIEDKNEWFKEALSKLEIKYINE